MVDLGGKKPLYVHAAPSSLSRRLFTRLYLVGGLSFLGNRVMPSYSVASALILLQVTAMAAGAFPLYQLASRATNRPWLAVLVSVSYVLHPSTWGIGLFDFHPECIAVPALLGALQILMKAP